MLRRVLFISSHAPSLLEFRGALITLLVKNGAEVIVLAPNISNDLRARLVCLGAKPVEVRMSRAGMNPLSDLLSLLDLYIKLWKYKPDVVFSYFIKPVIFGTIAAFFARVRGRIAMIEGLGYVFTYPDKELNFRKRVLKLVVSLLYRVSLNFASRVVFLNPDDQAEFVRMKLIKKKNSVCIGGIGVDLDRWRSEVLPTSVSFLMVARLLREKGVFEYAEAAKYVKLKYPLTNFILLGGLDQNPGAIQLGQVSEHIKAASVYVLPSYREGVPVSTMEAMAMGRPIITTDVPGCRETVVDGVNGFMVPAKDAVALAEKMIWFIENPSSIPLMGTASRRIAEEKFDVHKINEKLMQIMLGIEDEKTV
jgi:glycosyltransferase involved in cell wall biosynthesis